MDPEVVQDGIEVMEEFFKAWSSSESEDQDIVMKDDDSFPDIHLKDLQRHVHDFRSRIERNPWLQSVIQSF